MSSVVISISYHGYYWKNDKLLIRSNFSWSKGGDHNIYCHPTSKAHAQIEWLYMCVSVQFRVHFESTVGDRSVFGFKRLPLQAKIVWKWYFNAIPVIENNIHNWPSGAHSATSVLKFSCFNNAFTFKYLIEY